MEAAIDALSASSVKKCFDPYEDVEWEDIDATDPRWTLGPDDALGASAWYRAQSPALRARIGLHLAVQRLAVGRDFERILMRGLLELAGTLRDEGATLRYAYHEIVEEARHSLMFGEVIRRAGLHAPGLSAWDRHHAERVPRLGRTFPELFFVHVLGGEVPIDHVQRAELRRGDELHPLLARVMRIHVTEEARHVRFAELFLRERAPSLSPLRRAVVRWMAPTILWGSTRAMLGVPQWLAERYGMPAAVRAEIHASPEHRGLVQRGVAPILELLGELGLVTTGSRRLARALGLCGRRC